MSVEALGWVFSHSPYRGATFAVHLAVADSVNESHDWDFWMAGGNLATKARVDRKTITNALAELVDDGFLELLQGARDDDGRLTGRPCRYRFLMPEGVGRVTAPPRRASGRTRGESDPKGVGRRTPLTQGNPKEPREIRKCAVCRGAVGIDCDGNHSDAEEVRNAVTDFAAARKALAS